MKFSIAVLIALVMQPGPRAPLTPQEALGGRAIIQALFSPASENSAVRAVEGASNDQGEIWLTCLPTECELAVQALQRIQHAIEQKKIPRAARTIRIVSTITDAPVGTVKAAIHVAQGGEPRVIRSPWSAPSITDDVVETFINGGMPVVAFDSYGQLPLEAFGVGSTTVVTSRGMPPQEVASALAASAYFLATLPNEGSEVLLSTLVVGAHARLAEDGRRAVAMMGNQQRASADVLIMFGHAIEREQRRMRSFERFMPQPVDPMLHARILDMEKGITSVWTSMGITSSPFIPTAERLRGRGGEDKRVPVRVGLKQLPDLSAPTQFLTYPEVGQVMYELNNFIDGKRSISDIRDAVSAEFRSLPLPSVVDYFERLAKAGAITLK